MISDLSNYLAKRPDALILLGDRYETFIAAVAGVISQLKLFIYMEEIYVWFRDIYTDAITKWQTTILFLVLQKKIKQIGENKNNIFKVGALCNDNIKKIKTVNIL